MKKSELIKKLQEIDGDPEILMFNGFVEDWHEISLHSGQKLVKHSLENLFKGIKHELMGQKKEFSLTPQELKTCYMIAREQFLEQDWEFPNRFVEAGRHKDWYGNNQRDVVLIQGDKRGKSFFDRLGSMRY